jgi:hypothetical protein
MSFKASMGRFSFQRAAIHGSSPPKRAISRHFTLHWKSRSQSATSDQNQRARRRPSCSRLFTVDEQARALGLSRSTAWAVLKANHKATGLAAATINRMFSSPELAPHVRATILTYSEEKLAGHYGHNKKQLSRFKAGFSSPNRGRSFGSSWWPRPFIEQKEKSPAGTSPETGLPRGMDFPGPLRPRSARTERAAQTTQQNSRPR